MKKITLIVLTFFAIICNTTIVKAQSVKEGNILIDAYYGWPDIYIFSAKKANKDKDGFKLSSFGPFGGKFEYLLSDKIGLGLNFNYMNLSETYNYISWGQVYHYKSTTSKFRALVMFNFHFATSTTIDPYFFIGGGYFSRNFKEDSDQPNFIDESGSNLIPIAFRIGTGVRYFLNEKFGLHLELGIGGGAIIQGGITIKPDFTGKN